MEIKIIALGKDDRPLDTYGQDGKSFAETYAPIVDLLLKESRLHAVVHTVPGGPDMAEAVRRLIDQKRQEEGMAKEQLPFDLMPLTDVTARLRREDGCPWDRSQTHRTLRRYLIEEVYEMLDAIDSDDIDGIREELGDILYQVAIHARIAEEKGFFSAQDVVKDITNKMIRRHPYVFSQKSLENIGTSMLNWDRLKQGEQRQQHAHLLDGVVPGLPSLLTADKLQEKAAKVGFDWPDVEGAWEKFQEEWTEFRQALDEGEPVHAEEEAGDVLFVFADLCRRYHIEPECALHRANSKFRRRFAHVEDRVNRSGRPWEAFSLDELDSFWQEAKRIERQEKL